LSELLRCAPVTCSPDEVRQLLAKAKNPQVSWGTKHIVKFFVEYMDSSARPPLHPFVWHQISITEDSKRS
jgi:hypothetical protein